MIVNCVKVQDSNLWTERYVKLWVYLLNLYILSNEILNYLTDKGKIVSTKQSHYNPTIFMDE